MSLIGKKAFAFDYFAEVQSRVASIKETASELLAAYYPSATPEILCRSIASVAAYIGEAVTAVYERVNLAQDLAERDGDVLSLQTLDRNLSELAAHLRYVARAQSHRMPWTSLPAFEAWASRFLPSHSLMLRPKWNYNYTINPSDFAATYTSMVRTAALAKEEEPKTAVKRVLPLLDRPFYVVSFPALEKDNILLHSLLGHEVGHLLADEYLTAERVTAFSRSRHAEIRRLAEKELSKQPSEKGIRLLPEFERSALNELTARYLDDVGRMWRRALEELISDLTGAILLGPAALFSIFDYSKSFENADERPSASNNYYPPWRLRVRLTMETLSHLGYDLKDLLDSVISAGTRNRKKIRENALHAWIDDINSYILATTDKRILEGSSVTELVYRAMARDVTEARKHLLAREGLLQALCKPEQLKRALPALIERLDVGIPPNEYSGGSEDWQVADLAEIINAAWVHRISFSDPAALADYSLPDREKAEAKLDEAQQLELSLCLRDRRNRLTLKAIEFSYIAQHYRREVQPSPTLPRLSSPRTEAVSVIGKGTLASLLQEEEIRNALVVTPLLDPEQTLDEVSMDVRLGTDFILLDRQQFGEVDIKTLSSVPAGRIRRKVSRAMGEFFVLHPRELVIGSTLEYIYLPEGIMAFVVGKSSWGRLGLIIATATKVDPGFRGCITLEIVNLGEVPVRVYPGIPIAQLVFQVAEKGYRYEGRYNCATGPEFPKFAASSKEWSYWTKSRRNHMGKGATLINEEGR